MKTIGLTACAAVLLCLAGCSLYQNDRQWLWDSEYLWVRDVYDRCGSVDVVEKVLRDRSWTRAQINEARYRLSKDYSLDEKGIPRGIDRPRPVEPAKSQMGKGMGLGRSQTGGGGGSTPR